MGNAKKKAVGRVTPFVGVWIETILILLIKWIIIVTPFVGVWIETAKIKSYSFDI